MSERLLKHIHFSKTAALANKAKGNRHVEILSYLYADTSRFLEELLQNANDACLRNDDPQTPGKVRFVLEKNILYCYHNGKPFDEDDLIAITTIGQTTKVSHPDINLIGKFGLGFKSVFAICDTPEIHSGNYHYQITDFEVLQSIPPIDTGNYGTCIVMPLKQEAHIKSIVEAGLRRLSWQHLLFVKGYESVEVITETTHFILNRKTSEIIDNNLKMIRISDARQNDFIEFLVFSQLQHSSTDIQLAFSVCKKDESVTFEGINDGKVFVYFPTLTASNLSFIVHAGFTTTPTREQVPFDAHKTPENINILTLITEICQSLTLALKKSGLLNPSFWKMMPVFSDNIHLDSNPIVHSVYTGLIKSLNTQAVLPSSNNKLLKMKDLVVIDPELSTLLSDHDIQMLFGRKCTLNTQLSDYLNVSTHRKAFSKLKFIDEKDFAYALSNNPEVFKRKNIQWHKQLLKYIASKPCLWTHQHQEFWYSLREKPFILLNNMSLGAPYHQEKVQLYHFQKGFRNVPMVHRHLAEDDEIQRFFKLLELQIPDDLHEFRKNVLSEFQKPKQTIKKNFLAWIQFYEQYRKADSYLKTIMAKEISVIPCFPAKFTQDKMRKFACPSEVYLPTNEILNFLDGKTIPFADPALIDMFTSNGHTISGIFSFFASLGIHETPAYISFISKERDDDFYELREQTKAKGLSIVNEIVTDFHLEGLEDFFANPTPEKSLTIAKLLSAEFPNAHIHLETYTQQFSQTTEPAFLTQLKNNPWLYNHERALKTCNEISSLHNIYFQAEVNINKLTHLFHLNLSSELLNIEEQQVLNSLRLLKQNTGHYSQLINELLFSDDKNLPDVKQTDPLIIDVMQHSLQANTNPVSGQQFTNTEYLNLPHAHPSGRSGEWFDKHPSQKRAIEIAFKLLAETYDPTNVFHTSANHSAATFEIFQNNSLSFLVFVSGIKNTAGLFLFHFPVKIRNDQTPVIFLAIDNLSSLKPIVYRRIIYDNTIPDMEFGYISIV